MSTKEKMKYKCGWCQHQFEKIVGKSDSGKNVSSQVKCPRCGNFLKTWGE